MPRPIHSARPVLLLSFFESKTANGLVSATKKAHVPKGVPVYIGSYGINGEVSKKVHTLPNGRYAPIFAIHPDRHWTKRALSPHDAATLPASERKWAGKIPQTNMVGALPPKDQLRWGIELGRRMRDDLRAARAKGIKAERWQYDEVLGEAGQPGMNKLREFQRGVLLGLYGGRKELGDKPEKGIVFLAHTSLNLVKAPVTQEIAAFWKTLDQTSMRIVGEEYPDFVGNAKKAADVQGQGQRDLYDAGPIRRALAKKYVVGMSPGYRLGVGLGGNVLHKGRAEVNCWRSGFLNERAHDGVAGFAEYNYRYDNASQRVMDDTLREMTAALKRLPKK